VETAAPRRWSPITRSTGGRARRWPLALVALVGVTFVAAVSTASVAGAATGTVDVGTNANFGSVLTNAQGFALYTFPNDANGMSNCTGACASVWPALTVPAGTTPTAGSGVTGTVAAVLQTNGTYQVTYNGSPLYTFVGDTAAGQVTGNGVGGFSVVKVSAPATPPTTAPPATSPPTTAPPATSPPTTAPPATSAPTSATTAPTHAPATASAGSAAPPAAAASGGPSPSSSASTGATAPAPTTLAATGLGTGLQWMAVVGVVLIVMSIALSVLAVEDKTHRGRRSVRQVSRASWWLLGR
jgi:predicted lipoprotein with Yx(FWY)xxD motif